MPVKNTENAQYTKIQKTIAESKEENYTREAGAVETHRLVAQWAEEENKRGKTEKLRKGLRLAG